MKHKLEGLQSLVQMLHERGVGRLKAARKPLLSVHVEKHDDEDENKLLDNEMDEEHKPRFEK